MMTDCEDPFDFDTPVDRSGSSSLKWDRYKGSSTIPMWVADMDFKAPPAVIENLRQHIEHGVFGYTLPPGGLVEEVIAMLDKAHAWKVEPEWIVWLPGLVTGTNVACRAAGSPGDAIMTTTPAYPPFLIAPGLADRSLLTVPLGDDGSRYVFDFPAIEQAFDERTRMFILCNPQNPTGRVFTADELERLAEICMNHGAIICTDEIHCGLVLDSDKHHVSIASLSREIALNSITLLSPSKTYNLPGLGCSLAIIPDKGLRRSFRGVMNGIVPHVNALGFTAALAAYRYGEPWRKELVAYLRQNRDMVEEFVLNTPGISMRHVEATYLAWIDCRALDIEDPAAFFEASGVGLSSGADFGVPGFVRLNFGCCRSILREGLARLGEAVRRASL